MNYVLKRKVTNQHVHLKDKKWWEVAQLSKEKKKQERSVNGDTGKTILIEYVEVTNILIIDNW